jgi:hypothetical protein
MDEPDKFWQDLLAFIKVGRVIPVLGEGAMTFGDADTPLYPYLAEQLARRLKLDRGRLPPGPTLTDVVCEWLVAGGRSSDLYKELYFLHEEFDRQQHIPGSALRAIASIAKFNLILTTTFDSLLGRAVALTRPGLPPTVCGFFPNKDADEKDLPVRKARLPGTAIYHLFGQISLLDGEYVAWEEDTLDFICALHATLSTGKDLDLLARDLADNALLVVGLNFSDLLVRLFLRVAKQSRLTDLPHQQTLAELTPGLGRRGKVLFFGGVMKNVHVREQDPVDFARELAHRWDIAYPGAKADRAVTPRYRSMPRGAIFISYARENETVARKLGAQLREHGCVVWYDREQLAPGGYYSDDLQRAVKRDCSVFIALVSDTTETAETGYWRREREWAIERAPDFYPAEFYIPVCLGGVQPPFHREPERVREGVNAVSLPDRDANREEFDRFARRLLALQVRRKDESA